MRKHVRQFHQEKDAVVRSFVGARRPFVSPVTIQADACLCAVARVRALQVSEYVLGVFDEAATAQRHADAAQPFQEEPSATGAATRCVCACLVRQLRRAESADGWRCRHAGSTHTCSPTAQRAT